MAAFLWVESSMGEGEGEVEGEVARRGRGRGGWLLEMLKPGNESGKGGFLLRPRQLGTVFYSLHAVFASVQVMGRGDIVFDGIPRALINRGNLLFLLIKEECTVR